MKTAEQILDKIDSELRALENKPGLNDYLDGQLSLLETLKEFILESTKECEHEWDNTRFRHPDFPKPWVEECTKCWAIR